MSQKAVLGSLLAVLAASSAWATPIIYPNKASFLAAIHADYVAVGGLTTGSPTGRPAISANNGINRTLVIDSNVGGSPRLVSWSTGIGAPNPVNVTTVGTNGIPTTAFGCYLRISNNVNANLAGTVQVVTNNESFSVQVPAGGMYLGFTTAVAFNTVSLNADGNVVEMIDDVMVAELAGHPASEHSVDAGRAVLGGNSFNTQNALDDQFPVISTSGSSYGNSHDVWWTYTPGDTGMLSANTFGSNFDTLLVVYDNSGQPPLNGTSPLAFNDDSAGGLQSALSVHVIAGRCYHIRLGGFGGARGFGLLNLSFSPDFDCRADFNNDGAIDFFDYLDFVDAFSAGC